jgi:N-acetylglucosamine-6-phosphate deacetylase
MLNSCMTELRGIDPFTGKAVTVSVERGRIAAIRQMSQPPADFPFISPGFFDIQVNGFAGIDYSAPDLQPQAVTGLVSSLLRSGTTQHLATIITSPEHVILRNLRILSQCRESSREIADAIPGFHVEGPFICPDDGPRGAHDRRFVRDPDIDEFERWQDAASGNIRLLTLAPERPGAMALIEHAVEKGVTVAIGHTAADAQAIQEAVRAGVRLSTHLGVGSHHVLPRLKNYIWEQLAEDSLAASIIADGYHLPRSVIKVFARVKGYPGLILASDAAPIGGFPRGVYKWGDMDVEVFGDGHLGLAGTQTLAGAAHLLDWDLPRFLEATGCSLADALRLCTCNPARLLGMEKELGRLEIGAPAHLILFRYAAGEKRLKIEAVIRSGTKVVMENYS